MLIPLLTALILTQSVTAPKTTAQPGKQPPYAVSIQGVTGGVAIPITGTVNSSGAADTVGASATYNANSVCGSVATAGQTGAGFFIAAGTLTGTLTPSVSTDSTNGTNGTWTATNFVDISGNTSATLVLSNPNAAQAFGLKLMAGGRYAKVCTTAYTSGSAVGNLVASTPQPPPPAAGADVTDRAGRLLGQLTDGASAITPAKTGQLPTALDGSGFLKTHEQGTAAISAASLPLPTGAATETSLAKIPVAQASTTSGQSGALVQGAVTTAAPTYTTAQTSPLSLTTTGALRTDSSGTTQPVSGTFWQATQPVSGTVTTSPPANASTNVAQVAGTAADVNSGVKSAGTLRVVLATDQPQLTNKLLVTPDSVALPANQSVNVSQINAVTPLMGNGVTGTGSQRVTIASDNTAFTVNAAESGTWTVQPGNTQNTTPWLSKLHDGTTAAVIKAASTAPATTDPALIVTQSPNANDLCTSLIAVNQTTSTDLKTSSAKLHICSIILISATAQNISLTEGTGTVCATGAAAIIGGTTASVALAANGGFSAVSDRAWLRTATTSDHLCLLQSGAGNVSGIITYADQ